MYIYIEREYIKKTINSTISLLVLVCLDQDGTPFSTYIPNMTFFINLYLIVLVKY